MKIIHVITGLGTGGAELMLLRLLARMDRARFKNAVVSMTDMGTVGERIQALGVPVQSLNMPRGLPDPRGFWRLWRLLRRGRPDLVQTWLYHADLLGLLAAKAAGIGTVAWNLRCSYMDMRHYSKLNTVLLRLLARVSPAPSVVVANSETGRRFHQGLGYRPRRWEVIPNGFDLDVFRPDEPARAALREELGLSPNDFIIGYVARYDPMKDHSTFLAAARRLLDRHPRIHFVLVGQGMDFASRSLAKVIREFGIGQSIHLLGERSDIPRITAAFDLASSSSSAEGFPNVVGEAMACGVPCVVTDAGDSALIVGSTGRVVPIRDPQSLAGGWEALIRLGPEARRRLGLAARDRIRDHFSLEAVVRRYETLYAELYSPKGPLDAR